MAAGLEGLACGKYGDVLLAKGSVDGGSGGIEFDMVPGEHGVRTGSPDVAGKLCVIGFGLDEHGLAELFGL